MTLEVTQAAKDHIIKIGLRRRVRRPAAAPRDPEHDRGRPRRAAPARPLQARRRRSWSTRAKRPASRSRPPTRRRPPPSRPSRRRGAAPEPLRLPGLRRGLPPLGGAVPRVQRLELARRDRRARRPRPRPALAARAVAPPSPCRSRPSPTRSCPRLPVGLGELDRVLGGGLVPGSLVLVGGEPGIGKSTLLLQAAAGLAAAGRTVLYATGEESGGQVRLRADRLGLLGGPAAAASGSSPSTTSSGSSRPPAALRPAAVIVDSIQTATLDELDGPAGSVGQVREAALRFMELAKGEGIAVILVGHVTKDGSIAGPKTLEHLVDAVDRDRGRARRHPAPGPGLEEPVRRDRRGRRPRDGRGRPARGRRPGPGLPGRARRSPAPGQRRRGHARREPGAARRGPGARRADRLRDARGAPRSGSTRTGSPSSSPCSGRRAGVGLGSARRLRQPGRRDRGRRPGPRPAPRDRARVDPARPPGATGHRRVRRGGAPRRAAGGRAGRSAGCARRPASASRAPSCRARDRGRRRSRAWRSSPSATVRDALAGALEGSPADDRLGVDEPGAGREPEA